MTDQYTDHDRHEDLKVLHGMGYAQELQRNLSRFSNFAISFSIICILSGGINSLAQATSGSAASASASAGWSAASSAWSSRWRCRRSARPTPRPAGSTTGARSSATAAPAG